MESRLVVPEGAGSLHRSHCPYCLSSVHLDDESGGQAAGRAAVPAGAAEPFGTGRGAEMIRLEQKQDWRAVENLTREAFWNVYRPGCVEHLVLHRLREDACFVPELDYVLEEDGEILAHIAYAKGVLSLDGGGQTEMLLFGPVSVLPERQGRGYGSKIIRDTLERAAEMGFPAVAITGAPEYYSRFGFESASKYGIYHAMLGHGVDAPFFMVKVLDPDRMAGLRGLYADPACYEVSEEEVEAFDRAFPPKKKEVRPGQLTAPQDE